MMKRFYLVATGAAMAFSGCTDATAPANLAGPKSPGDGPRITVFGPIPQIVFSSTRDNPTSPFNGAEIYLMNGDGTDPQRLTVNEFGDGLASLSPDGKKIVFDSNRLRNEDEPLNTSDLFVMKADGTEQQWLTRGSSGSWSPDGKRITFHASASGTGLPIKSDPGAATFDSDIFIMNVDDAGLVAPINITNDPLAIDDDPHWSPGGQKIAFTSHSVDDNHLNSVTAEIFLMNPDGSGRARLTYNTEEERAAAWSPDGTRIAFMCRRGGSDFEICVMNADGSDQVQLTNNTIFDGGPSFSPDGGKMVFIRTVPGQGQQIFVMNADGTGPAQLTSPPGVNTLPNWGELRVKQP